MGTLDLRILADLWSIAKVGVASTLGLIGVVSLPRAFVFRINLDDPHPFPWIRVKLSCAIGRALYPHPQWSALARLWESFYPPLGLDPTRRRLVALLEASLPGFVALLVAHRPRSLRGASLLEAIGINDRQPARLSALPALADSSGAHARSVANLRLRSDRTGANGR